MRSLTGSITFLIILLILDFYIFQAIRTITASFLPKWRTAIHIGYWLVSVAIVLFFLFMPYIRSAETPAFVRNQLFALLIGVLLAKIVSLPFILVDDIRRLLLWLAVKFTRPESKAVGDGIAISRSIFLSWLGVGIGSLLFGTLWYGFRNKYRYKTRTKALSFSTLPSAFHGFKIVQISDIHSGSFADKEAVAHGVKMINDLDPDIILFTGDLVNDRAEEIVPYKEIFAQLKSKHGVYSTLGNHDYGDYFPWPDRSEGIQNGQHRMTPLQQKNLDTLKQHQADMGWKMLNDDSAIIQQHGESIAIIGVQNISGKSNFKSYGNLSKAYAPAAEHNFKILMSHDPSHWDAEVKKQYPDINLTLSGHTHGMQFGVEIPGLKWSPVQWVYKQWAGLYGQTDQYLYVNRGYGFIGYPGRVGIMPEITLITLQKA